jgi:hypothetical protein
VKSGGKQLTDVSEEHIASIFKVEKIGSGNPLAICFHAGFLLN